MARIHDLIRQVAAQAPNLAHELEREVGVLSERRAFGLNFERHTPEEVELPGQPVRRGDKVHVLPPRGETPKAENGVMWVVESIDRSAGVATVTREDAKGAVHTGDVALAELVVVAEFRDPIYPGVVSTGTVERGGDKPYHSVINGENFHALQTLLFTHRGKVDAIYIDPPYNTGARDWKYNNDYVESDDQYRHSKWLAFMERRLILAKELLNPDDSVLIVAIDEKEYLRLGMLLEQMFPEADISMVTTVISAKGAVRPGRFSRVEEHIFFVFIGAATVKWWDTNMLPGTGDEGTRAAADELAPIEWLLLRRREPTSVRIARPNQFYPIFVNTSTGHIHSIGDPVAPGVDRNTVVTPQRTVALWPLKPDGTEMLWGLTPDVLRRNWEQGFVRIGSWKPAQQKGSVQYLQTGIIALIKSGGITVTGRNPDGSVIGHIAAGSNKGTTPKRVWNMRSHNAETGGTNMVSALLPGRRFPFPKSLYAVEDALRFVVEDKSEAVVIDFFSGSGTTAHAVMRLNKQDGGRRVSISVTNNEVSAEEQGALRKEGFRPGDSEWEWWGICEYITKPRINAAITGNTPDGAPVKGNYRFTDVFPLADGLEENVEFFTTTYEAPLRVASHRDFPKVAPLLWLRAGSTGRRIDSLDAGWDVADTYGVLADLDKSDEFVTAAAAAPGVRVAFVITDEDRLFEAIVRDLPDHVEPVRMYDAYLRNFELESRVPR